jgi:hypothetical protein
MENQEPEISVEKQEAVASDTPKNILFGTITYADDTAYEKFISNMDLNQSIFVLIASANFAQAKGAFNILESEVLSSAIRTIRKNSKPAQPVEE